MQVTDTHTTSIAENSCVNIIPPYNLRQALGFGQLDLLSHG